MQSHCREHHFAEPGSAISYTASPTTYQSSSKSKKTAKPEYSCTTIGDQDLQAIAKLIMHEAISFESQRLPDIITSSYLPGNQLTSDCSNIRIIKAIFTKVMFICSCYKKCSDPVSFGRHQSNRIDNLALEKPLARTDDGEAVGTNTNNISMPNKEKRRLAHSYSKK